MRTPAWVQLPVFTTLLLAACVPPLPENVDDDGDGVSAASDCDDADSTVGAGASWYLDGDGDGYGDAGAPSESPVCPGQAGPTGYVPNANDCDDASLAVNPDAAEVCDGADDDCDGLTDDADTLAAGEGSTFYADGDRDGSGDAGVITARCEAGDGWVAAGDDCDDGNPDVHPGAPEVCDEVDNDCDDAIDEDATDATPWYPDADGDGFGDPDATEVACASPDGFVVDGTDCDDADSARHEDADGDGACDLSFSDYTTAYGSAMIAIVAGTFTMGGGTADATDVYQDHEVTLTHDFWIGETELTRAAWESWAGGAGWVYSSDGVYPCTTSSTTATCPADTITAWDVARYANALSTAEGLTSCYVADGTALAAAYVADPYACPGYRLPTEAEWEYAARAGEDTAWSGSSDPGAVAWYADNAYAFGTFAHEVGTLAPNRAGLHDMSGNLYEWVGDWYDSSEPDYGSGAAVTDPSGPSSGTNVVIRGGSFYHGADEASVAYRKYRTPDYGDAFVGARLVRTLGP